MDKKVKLAILKAGGKKALKKYNSLNRIPLPQMSTATIVMENRKRKPEKYRTAITAEDQ